MRSPQSRLQALILLVSCATAASANGAGLKDLYFGEAFFHAHQGAYFDAIARLDTELDQYYEIDDPSLDSLSLHIGEAEFSVGDFELSWRMHKRAGRAYTAVIEGNVSPAVRNEALYRLARIHFQKGRPADALAALDRIDGAVAERIRIEAVLLRGQALLALDRPAEAVAALAALQGAGTFEGFRRYNLGIALLQAGRVAEAREQLDAAGRINGASSDVEAIRDRANLVAGKHLMDGGNYGAARGFLDRVRLDGLLSNRALLGAGWTDAGLGNYERALVPWTMLAGRNVTDGAVQEALMAVPYAYGKLNVYGKAALLYRDALDAFTRELGRLDASIASVRDGGFLEALVRAEIRQDAGWVVRLRELPRAPETWYLTELMASHEFQEALANYLDLDEMRVRLAAWQGQLDAFADLIARRRDHYEPLLPQIDRRFRELDTKIRLRRAEHAQLHAQLESMLETPRIDLLATAEERAALGEESPAGRAELLRGVVLWQVHTEYHERYTRTWRRIRELDRDLEAMEAAYEAFVRARQAATLSYVGYDATIADLKARAHAAHGSVESLMVTQGRLIEAMAIEELERRRARLQEYQVQARFAMADSYDRAIRTADAGGGAQ